MFKKKDFKSGMVVELSGGQRRLFWEDKFIDQSGYIPFRYFNDNLINTDRMTDDENINKVFLTHDVGYFKDFFRDENLTEIWKR